MSISLGAENNTVLEIFSYYHQLYEWKSKIKRKIKSKIFRGTSQQDTRMKTCSQHNINRHSVCSSSNNSVFFQTEKPRCVSMVELSGGFYSIERKAPPKNPRSVKRATSFKQKILHQAGKLYSLKLFFDKPFRR